MPQPAWCCNGYPGQQRPWQRPCRLLCPLPALWQSTLCLSWSAASLGQHGSSHGGRPEAASRPVPNVERCCEHSFSVSSHRPCWDLTDSRKPVPAWGGDPFEVCEAWICGGGMLGAFRRYKKRSTKGTPLPTCTESLKLVSCNGIIPVLFCVATHSNILFAPPRAERQWSVRRERRPTGGCNLQHPHGLRRPLPGGGASRSLPAAYSLR